MNKKKKIILIVSLAILLVLGVVIGYSFAYFSATVINGTPINETLVTTSALEIEFTDGPEVSLVNAIPGTSVTKTFKIENKTNLNTTYDVYMSEVVNEFVDKSDLVYTITSNDGGYNTSGEIQVPDENKKVIDAQLLRGNETHNYTLKVEFKEKFEIQDDNKNKEISFTIRVNEERKPIKPAVDVIKEKDVVDDETADHNLRYIGANPDNYVLYNDELWRIIGVMNNIETESGFSQSLLKIMRSDSLGEYSWDSSSGAINYNSGINQWAESTYEDSTSYEGADLMRELNTDYLGNITVGTDGYWYTYMLNQKNTSMPNSSLSLSSQNMIESVVWNLGSPNNDNGTAVADNSEILTYPFMYNHERLNSNGKICSYNMYVCNDTVTRTSTWTGKVGLIYPSDYGFATSGGQTTSRTSCMNLSVGSSGWLNESNSDCKNNNWLYHENEEYWTISPYTESANAFLVYWIDSYNRFASAAYQAVDVYPTVYLKSNVSITGGTGTQVDPYTLG